ncbi:hypothetical protein [Streptomyces sp. NPDC056796]|uniref:hypothetical protein n=1 Tax=Streptomyces sp. NPDC056796 TaxID=3345947 RepID=UPI0036C5D986
MNFLRSLFRKSSPALTEAEYIGHLQEAFEAMGDVLGDYLTSRDVGEHFTCRQADTLAFALAVGGQIDAAVALLEGHALGDSEKDGDDHLGGEDFNGSRYLNEVALAANA